MTDLLKNREEASILFYKSYFELEEKKDKALQTADLGKLLVVDFGNVELSKDEITRNKLIAKHVMLPDVRIVHEGNKEAARIKNILRFSQSPNGRGK